jgi:hypothetical protein
MNKRWNCRRIDFDSINKVALPQLPNLCRRWLKDGRVCGHEYVARNPRRRDDHVGSFKVNLISGRWADFALEGIGGGDPVSLAAYLAGCSQIEAARQLRNMLGIGHG